MNIKKEYMAPEAEWGLLSINCQILQSSDGGMDEGGELNAPPLPSNMFDDFIGVL